MDSWLVSSEDRDGCGIGGPLEGNMVCSILEIGFTYGDGRLQCREQHSANKGPPQLILLYTCTRLGRASSELCEGEWLVHQSR
jgi:hypothetical protein